MLKYLGNGFLKKVPARDLTKDEVEGLGLDPDVLVGSGLYALAESSSHSLRSGTMKLKADSDKIDLARLKVEVETDLGELEVLLEDDQVEPSQDE